MMENGDYSLCIIYGGDKGPQKATIWGGFGLLVLLASLQGSIRLWPTMAGEANFSCKCAEEYLLENVIEIVPEDRRDIKPEVKLKASDTGKTM